MHGLLPQGYVCQLDFNYRIAADYIRGTTFSQIALNISLVLFSRREFK